MLQSLAQYGPDAIRAITDVGPYVGQAEQNLNNQLAPQAAALQTKIYGDYGPQINAIGANINRANQLAASQTEAELAGGPGRQLVSEADALQRQLDPEYYANRATIGNAVNAYLSSMSPSTLTPTELEQINRGISARQGNIPDSALSTIRNAQTFGNALQQKQQNFGNAIATASSALPGLKSGISGFEVATQRPLISNSGDARLSSPTAISPTSAMDQNFGFANNILSNIGANQRTSINKQKDIFDMVNSATSSFGNVASGIGSLV
jgi:hypothetical protein